MNVVRLIFLMLVIILPGCASSPIPGGNGVETQGKVAACKPGDTQVAGDSACLQDDAACYQIVSGDWCTGPRNATCPAGSTEMAVGEPCPSGVRCFQISESLTCGTNAQ